MKLGVSSTGNGDRADGICERARKCHSINSTLRQETEQPMTWENRDGVKWNWGKPAVQTQRSLLCKKPQPCASCQGKIMCLCVKDSELKNWVIMGVCQSHVHMGCSWVFHLQSRLWHWEKPDMGPNDQSGHTVYPLPGPLPHVCPTPFLSIRTYNLETLHPFSSFFGGKVKSFGWGRKTSDRGEK